MDTTSRDGNVERDAHPGAYADAGGGDVHADAESYTDSLLDYGNAEPDRYAAGRHQYTSADVDTDGLSDHGDAEPYAHVHTDGDDLDRDALEHALAHGLIYIDELGNAHPISASAFRYVYERAFIDACDAYGND